ncbi:sensor domain-containing diguanylate cyclase [Rhodocyclus tenuis]|uniref:Diguanylate cyclase (GGDEF)-like protein/PAS domain S-box-containing protein n=1 Tax=Rhodocyclus tenuis TaxID=1066 RepID=A0A840GCY9_RHOTE|nr:sensor domain-containing diguanylate cyclase [Rhodocyclus tenuis]MBB4246432.1 diguanylate cyclase (GGDEF)-like protein/PAS domain S-box-containing protein [Rhodocyclus tenuis]
MKIVLLGYCAAEVDSIQQVLAPLTRQYGLGYRTVPDVGALPAALDCDDSCFVIANDWHGGVNVEQVIECCRQHDSRPPIVFASGNLREEMASQVIDSGADGYVFWDRLFQLRWFIHKHLQKRRWLPTQLTESAKASARINDRLSTLLDLSSDAIVATDPDFRIIFFNKGAERIFGHSADEILGHAFSTLLPAFSLKAFANTGFTQAPRSTASELAERTEVDARRKDGTLFPAEVSIAVLEEDGGAICLAILRDIAEKKRVAEHIVYLATHDSLTGLPNRNLFLDRLAHAIDVADRNEKLMALMFIDLDGFKQVNDLLGHAAGDELLQVVAGRLRGQLRAADTVARLGGDEFAVILEHLEHVDPISQIAADLIRVLDDPIVTAQGPAIVSASIGIVICPLEAKTTHEMMIDADRAMYAAKAAGKGRFLFYSAEMSPEAALRQETPAQALPAHAAATGADGQHLGQTSREYAV